VFPEEVGAYFGAWRARQLEALEEVREAFSPVPVLYAPYFASEPVGGAALDELAGAVFSDSREAAALLHTRLTQELRAGEGEAVLRLDLPFASKGDISLRKIGAEVIVRVDGHKRTVVLPPALAGYRADGAAFTDGALELRFVEAETEPAPDAHG
jgi:arsenite-transporting ATPase